MIMRVRYFSAFHETKNIRKKNTLILMARHAQRKKRLAVEIGFEEPLSLEFDLHLFLSLSNK